MNKKPRILTFDIETAPMEVYAWGTGEQHVNIEQIIKPTSILAFAGKFVGESKIHYFDTSDRKDPRDDKELLKKATAMINEADVLVSQNGIGFDNKKINSRLYFQNLPRPDLIKKKHVDLYLEGKRVFGHDSHKLAWITQKLDSSHRKSSHAKFPGLALWIEVLKGNKAAWKEMRDYNKQDVLATEAVFKDYMTWFDHIDLRPTYKEKVFNDVSCRACGSGNTVKHDKRRTVQGLFQRYLCKDCGCVTTLSGGKNNLDKHPNGWKPTRGKKNA